MSLVIHENTQILSLSHSNLICSWLVMFSGHPCEDGERSYCKHTQLGNSIDSVVVKVSTKLIKL